MLAYKIRMLTHSLRERAEDDSLLCKSCTESCSYRYRIEHGINSNARQSRSLVKRNAQLVESLLKLGVDLLRTVLRLLRSRIINDILEIYLWYIEMRPLRHRHLLPAAESLKTELKHPIRLLLLG